MVVDSADETEAERPRPGVVMGIGREGGVDGEAMGGEEKLLRNCYFSRGSHRRRCISRRQEEGRIWRRGGEQVGLTETQANKSICRLELGSLTKELIVTPCQSLRSKVFPVNKWILAAPIAFIHRH